MLFSFASGVGRRATQLRRQCLSTRAVPLQYTTIQHPPSDIAHRPTTPRSSSSPCILIHGLLGSRTNLRVLTRLLPFQTFILPDLRNHGESPHTDRMSLIDMAADILACMDAAGAKQASLVGHSLGGRVAMSVALLQPDRVARLAVLDIPPGGIGVPRAHGRARSDVQQLLHLLDRVPLHELKSKKEVKHWLATHAATSQKPLSDVVLSFLVENVRTSHRRVLEWKPNLKVLIRRFNDDILQWPFTPDDKYTHGPVVFIKGSESAWIEPAHLPLIRTHFPRARFATVEAGHWVHHEAPREVAKYIRNAWQI